MESVVNFECKNFYTVSDLQKLIAFLRCEHGCPWDREQTHQSIRRNLLEEAYEACEAIDTDNTALLLEELGDVLTQVIFHAQIKEEQGQFTLDDVANATCQKLVFRHPHLFGDATAKDSDEVMLHWDELKRREKNYSTVAQTMQGVARSLPATWRAEKIQTKAAKVGFDWADAAGALDKLEEEIAESRAALQSGNADAIADEIGDLLFSAVNAARLARIDPETALHAAADKFTARFSKLEQTAIQAGNTMADMPLAELESLWQAGK